MTTIYSTRLVGVQGAALGNIQVFTAVHTTVLKQVSGIGLGVGGSGFLQLWSPEIAGGCALWEEEVPSTARHPFNAELRVVLNPTERLFLDVVTTNVQGLQVSGYVFTA